MRFFRIVRNLITSPAARALKAKKAFEDSIRTIGHPIDVSNLPSSVKVLEPKLVHDRYEIAVTPAKFFRGSARFPTFTYSGALVATVGNFKTKSRDGLTAHASELQLNQGDFYHVFGFSHDSSFQISSDKQVNSFGHILLFNSRGKAVVLIPLLQKVTGRTKNQRIVDKFADSQGRDRHFLLLALGHRVVEEMQKRGIKAELHVPAPEHIIFMKTATEGTKRRALRPFEELARHFKEGRVDIGDIELKTINLSKPKRRKG
ncbi:MAG: hypothetical protein V1644_01640 [Candidatus Micrarchaeota archaeon]